MHTMRMDVRQLIAICPILHRLCLWNDTFFFPSKYQGHKKSTHMVIKMPLDVLASDIIKSHQHTQCSLQIKKTRQIWGIWKLRLAYSPETPNLGQNMWCFVPCDLKIWWMTLKNDRASLLCCSNWSYSPETPNLGQIRRFLEPCDL